MTTNRENFGGWRERAVLRGVVIVGVFVAVGVAAYFAQNDVLSAVPITGGFASIFFLAVAWSGRVRSREQWERAWDSYLLQQERSVSSQALRSPAH